MNQISPVPNEEIFASLLASKGDLSASKIMDSLRKAGVTHGCYAYKFRVKSSEGLLEKRDRKIRDKPNYCLTDITDVIGIRLVTLFKSDMLEVYTRLIEHIHNAKTNDTLEFNGRQPEEVIVYKGKSIVEDFCEEIKKKSNSFFPDLQIESANSLAGYSSIHVICRHSEHIKQIIDGYYLPIEIQIRTVFEDAWGEIEHKYSYSSRVGKTDDSHVLNAPHIKNHLKVLKDFTDACMEYAECIRKEARCTQSSVQLVSTKTISVEFDRYIIEQFERDGLDSEFIKKFICAREIRNDAAKLATKPDEWDGAFRKYFESSQMFLDISKEICPTSDISLIEKNKKMAFYYCKINEALCYMVTNDVNLLQSAHEIYVALEGHYNEFPFLKMRLGQVLGKLGYYDESIDKLRSAKIMMEECRIESEKSGSWPERLPKVDYEHMLWGVPKLLGFSIWGKSQDTNILPEQRVQLYLDAYCETLLCIDHVGEGENEIDVFNNLLYYSCGFIFYAPLHHERYKPMKAALKEHLEKFISFFQDPQLIPPEELDTIFHSYVLTDNPKAEDTARNLVQACVRSTRLSSYAGMEIAKKAQYYIDNKKLLSM